MTGVFRTKQAFGAEFWFKTLGATCRANSHEDNGKSCTYSTCPHCTGLNCNIVTFWRHVPLRIEYYVKLSTVCK